MLKLMEEGEGVNEKWKVLGRAPENEKVMKKAVVMVQSLQKKVWRTEGPA